MNKERRQKRTSAESVEQRPPAEGNPDPIPVTGAPYPEAAWSWRERIRQAAKRNKDLRFTSLLHHITPELLAEAYEALKRQAAPGVDGMRWEDYGEGLSDRLFDLHKQ